MKVQLHPQRKVLHIQQKMIVFNTSKDTLNNLYLHDWINAYKDKKTPLAKRFTDNFSKSFHFASKQKRGFTKIISVNVNGERVTWENVKKLPDIRALNLKTGLLPNQFATIHIEYEEKIPDAKFTSYGENKGNYYLKYWYLVPAVISKDKNEVLMSNLDMGDLYADFSDYHILFEIPKTHTLTSDLKTSFKIDKDKKIYTISGKSSGNVTLSITSENNFTTYQCNNIKVVSDMESKKITRFEKEKLLKRQLRFLESYFGEFPRKKMMIREVDYKKNPIYGLNQLPSFLNLFEKNFDWDLKMFKEVSQKYIDALFAFNKRVDYAITDGLPTYMTMQYVKEFYPKATFIGKASKWMILKNYEIAKMNFADRYHYFYNLTSQHRYSQPFSTPLDSLSNFNRKIISKYKSAVYMNMIDKNLKNNSLKYIICRFSEKYRQKKASGKLLLKQIESEEKNNISWLRKDFLQKEKQIDYSFKKVKKQIDSINIKISTGVKTTTPFRIYGIKNGVATYEKKVEPNGKDIQVETTIPNYNFDRLAINKKHIVPENNLRNNWENLKGIFDRPFKFSFVSDIEKPKYQQVFYNPEARYNFYDGIILGVSITNSTLSWKNFTYKVLPSYGFKSGKLSGSYFLQYKRFAKSKSIREYGFGIGGSHYQYARNLNYNALTPYAYLVFSRKDLRYPIHQKAFMKYTSISRQKPTNLKDISDVSKVYNYDVFNIRYDYFNPGILNESKIRSELQIASNFSKISTSFRYRKLTDKNRQITLRFFGGMFLYNTTKNDFFSFALDRPTDYLFQYNYLGRSETQGILSQQVIVSEGGFTSKLSVPFANSWIATSNASVSIWRWFEIYGNLGLVKNKGKDVYFAHEAGLKFSFIPDMLEFYFPMHSNLGWEISQPKYASKIRFVIEADINSIYNFIRRGFY